MLSQTNAVITIAIRLRSGVVLALARWGANGGHNSSWGPGAQYVAELRILLVFLSESLGRLGQNGEGHWGHIFHWVRPPGPPVEPPLTTIRLRSDYDVSRTLSSNSTQAKNEHVNFCRSRIVVESQL